MISSGQFLSQKQTLQQRLSPQQIQFIKLLQLPTLAFEQRVKEELEENPVLDEVDFKTEDASADDKEDSADEPEIDWDSYLQGNDRESYKAGRIQKDSDWQDLPNPYHESFLEALENQVNLLKLTDKERLIADQILGSIDEDGYLRRDLDAIADSIAFNNATLVNKSEIESVLSKIQHMDPPGVAARNLRECLLVQLEFYLMELKAAKPLAAMLKNEWDAFEKKHFDKIQKHLNLDDDQLREAYECIQSLNPKPGGSIDSDIDTANYIVPDFEVYFEPNAEDSGEDSDEEGEFIITLSNRNIPNLQISPRYKKMWDELKGRKNEEAKETKTFIKNKLDSAQWFLESIMQRYETLMNVMKTIVALQEDFFKTGDSLKPMILKDIADRISMDISTVSRVVNGKYVQTNFGIYELKYFFNEGVETESGEEVSNREVKNYLEEIVRNEDKTHPLSDQALVKALQEKGYKLARRTVSKYREQLNIPVARLRKEL